MAKTQNTMMAKIAAGLKGLVFGGKKKNQKVDGTLSGNTKKLHGREAFNPFWLFLKGAQSRHHEGQSEIPQWEWPDKNRYGMAQDGSVRHREPQVPFRVRRWRKRTAARIAKAQRCPLDYAKQVVKGLEASAVRSVIRARQGDAEEIAVKC